MLIYGFTVKVNKNQIDATFIALGIYLKLSNTKESALQFQTAVIYQFFGSSLAVQSLSLCKLIICMKAFQWQLTAVL